MSTCAPGLILEILTDNAINILLRDHTACNISGAIYSTFADQVELYSFYIPLLGYSGKELLLELAGTYYDLNSFNSLDFTVNLPLVEFYNYHVRVIQPTSTNDYLCPTIALDKVTPYTIGSSEILILQHTVVNPASKFYVRVNNIGGTPIHSKQQIMDRT